MVFKDAVRANRVWALGLLELTQKEKGHFMGTRLQSLYLELEASSCSPKIEALVEMQAEMTTPS